MIRVVGLDLSVARTGFALPDGRTLSCAPRQRAHAARLHELASRIFARIDIDHNRHRIDIAVVEGYLTHTAGAEASYRLAELGGVIRLFLYARGIPYVEVHPSTLKSWAGHVIGRPPASKDDMISAALTLGYQPRNDDEADAALLHAIGVQRYQPDPDRPGMTETLARLRWPELAGASHG